MFPTSILFYLKELVIYWEAHVRTLLWESVLSQTSLEEKSEKSFAW